MKKSEYIENLSSELKEATNGRMYINVTQFAKCIGVARETAVRMLFTLKYLSNGNEKLFFVPEVAQHLYEILTADSAGEIRKWTAENITH